MKYTLVLPLPPKQLHPNATLPRNRMQSIYRSERVKKARYEAGLIAKSVMDGVKCAAAELQPHFYLPIRNDASNLNRWLKAYEDGIADVIAGGNDAHFRMLEPLQTTGKGLDYRVEITVDVS